MYQLDCDYCGVTVEGEAVKSVKTDAKTHLKENHSENVLADLSEQQTEIPCQDGCGYTIPIGVEDIAGVDCPDCGHDNLLPLLEQYVFWRITKK